MDIWQLIKNSLTTKSSKEPKFYRNVFEVVDETDFIKVVPIGSFPRHHDGAHVIEKKHVEEMANNLNSGGTDLLFDYGHQSVWLSEAKAAGWSPKELAEAREDGLYIKYPLWTPGAAEAIKNREYRYFSPVYALSAFDKQGNDIGAVLHSVGLVNKPYMDTEINHIGNSEVRKMKFSKEFLQKYGLNENATAEEVEQAIANAQQSQSSDSPITPPEPTVAPVQPESQEAGEVGIKDVVAMLNGINKRLDASDQRFQQSRDQEIEALVNSAIADFRISPKDKDLWLQALQNDFEKNSKLLAERAKNSARPGKVQVDDGGGDGTVQSGKRSKVTFDAFSNFMKANGGLGIKSA